MGGSAYAHRVDVLITIFLDFLPHRREIHRRFDHRRVVRGDRTEKGGNGGENGGEKTHGLTVSQDTRSTLPGLLEAISGEENRPAIAWSRTSEYSVSALPGGTRARARRPPTAPPTRGCLPRVGQPENSGIINMGGM